MCAKTDPQGNRMAKRTLELCPKCLMMSSPLTSELGSCPSLGPPCAPQVADAQHMFTEGLCMHVYMMFYQILEHSQPDLRTAKETFNEYLLCAITGPSAEQVKYKSANLSTSCSVPGAACMLVFRPSSHPCLQNTGPADQELCLVTLQGAAAPGS